jgi:hypothetical protein
MLCFLWSRNFGVRYLSCMTRYCICPYLRHPVSLGNIETNNWIRGKKSGCLLCQVWAKCAHFDILREFLSFALWSFLHRHHCCFADSLWIDTRPPRLTSPKGCASFGVSVSGVLLGNETVSVAARRAVFLWLLSSERPLGSNVCAFFTL